MLIQNLVKNFFNFSKNFCHLRMTWKHNYFLAKSPSYAARATEGFQQRRQRTPLFYSPRRNEGDKVRVFKMQLLLPTATEILCRCRFHEILQIHTQGIHNPIDIVEEGGNMDSLQDVLI